MDSVTAEGFLTVFMSDMQIIWAELKCTSGFFSRARFKMCVRVLACAESSRRWEPPQPGKEYIQGSEIEIPYSI